MTALMRVAHESQLVDHELPRDYRGLSLDRIPHANVRQVALDYLTKFWDVAEQGIAPGFFGRSGAYKTWAASVIAEAVSEQGMVPALYVACGPEFNALERRRYDERSEARLQQLVDTEFVVLDDITDVRAGGFAMDMLTDVIKLRDANGRPTLYTGNALFTPTNPDALIQQFGAATTRRILEGSKGYLVVVR